MRALFVLILSAAVLGGCHKQTHTRTTAPEEPKAEVKVVETPPAPVKDLEVRLEETEVAAMWGMVTEVPVTVEWHNGQKYAVQLAAVDAPDGVQVETVPAIVNPPGRSMLRITPQVGSAPLRTHEITLEASAYGMRSPVRESLKVSVIREDGDFVPVMAGPVTLECRNVCGKVSGGRVTFYDVLHEKEQTCASALPASQRIGTRSFALSPSGFGFGRTCRVAAAFEPTGGLSVVNIGGPTPRVPRGEVFTTISSAAQCWLSPDNTLALAKSGAVLRLFDVYSGTQIGDACTLAGDMPTPTLAGTKVAAGSCGWEVE